VVAHGGAATARLVDLLAERQLGVSLVVDVDSLDLELRDVVRWAATDPRVGVVVVQSPELCRAALESALGEVASRAPVAVMDGSGRGEADGMERREMCATTLVELADLAMLVLNQPRLAGRQVAFVTNDRLHAHDGVDEEMARASLLGPDLTQHAEQRSKSLSPGTRMSGAVTAVASDVAPQVLLDVLTTIGERGVDAVVVALVSTSALGRREIEQVLRDLKRAIPHVVIVNVDPHPRSPRAPVPVFASDGGAITALGEVVHAEAAWSV
jgi:acyl-CoA synthetase (NDP forming)